MRGLNIYVLEINLKPDKQIKKNYPENTSLKDLTAEFDQVWLLDDVISIRLWYQDTINEDNAVLMRTWINENDSSVEINPEDVIQVPRLRSIWTWEKDKPHAREEIVVIGLKFNEVDDITVETARTDGKPSNGERYSFYSDLSRFWEAVTPVGELYSCHTQPRSRLTCSRSRPHSVTILSSRSGITAVSP